MLFEEEVIVNQRTIFGSQRGKWITLAALVAILVSLLAVGVVRAQDAAMMSERDYAENGTDPVVTLTAADPEERMVYWSLLPATTATDAIVGVDGDDDTDASHFMITPSADGASASLSFKLPPDYEMPRGNATDTNNTYKVVVVAADDAPGAVVANDVDDSKKTYHKLTVMVTDEDEDGSISLSTQQPQVDVALTATLTDPDSRITTPPRPIANETWKWEQSSAMDGPWSLISGAGGGNTNASESVPKASDDYTPAADIAGMYLRVTVTYTDKHGDDKSAMAVSANAVRAVPSGTNSDPTFPSGTDDNTREVDENSPPGSPVGDPVKASDAPGETLTYTLTGTNAELYSIDRATGQISVGARTMLNREGLDLPFQHTVIVTATDPYGPPDDDPVTQTVTITINDVNEAPTVSGGPTRIKHQEGSDPIDLDSVISDVQAPIYAATDPESTETAAACTNVDQGSICAWSLEGPDAADFMIGDETTDDTAFGQLAFGQLAFKNAPDFENPADADMDNIYEVTVKVADNGVANKNKMSATRDVMITVINANDPGKITLSSVQPKVGIDFKATLTDEDGGVEDEKVKWQWAAVDAGVDDVCTNVSFDDEGEDNIPMAKSDTYQPKSGTSGTVGDCLRVTAVYTDTVGLTNAMETAVAPVVENQDNQAPEFKDANGKAITSDTRIINENTEANTDDDDSSDDVATDNIDNIDGPVVATDPNGDADILTYTLGGPDAAMFRVRQPEQGGQIEVGTGTKLDYERKKSYMVTVTATDPSQLSTTIDITIMVIDVNEGPVIAGEDDLTKEFRENSTGTIETFRATDPEGRPVYWSLNTADADYPDHAAFTINSSGSLSFENPTDFETPSDDGEDNTYKVIVVASDDAPGVETPIVASERMFIVRVTNVAERGSVDVNRRYPQVDVPVTATLTDGDATGPDIDSATWQWYKGQTEAIGDGANSVTYRPLVGDVGTLRVEASYRAKGDDRKASKSIVVRAMPTGDNAPPVFPIGTQARSVDENRANANVGLPITATDSNSFDVGKLTYTVSDDVNFSITRGQLKTKVALDHETPLSDFTVTATDPSGLTATVTVTVTVNDINEVPMIVSGPTRALPWIENNPSTDPVATYMATDVDGDDLVWSLTGPDASDFYIGNQEGSTPGQLTFKKKPDYEMPDASNNVYRVTVEVSDGKLKATRPMTVMVTDVEEDGMVTMSSVQPRVAVPLTASLKDSDGGETDVTWKWAHDVGVLDNVSDCIDSIWTTIEGATSDTYTPKGGVAEDIGKCLRATASYTDRRGEQTAEGVSDNPVIADTDNRAPMFETKPDTRKVAENTEKGMEIGDGVIEPNAVMDTGIPVIAVDPNEDRLTYTLGGTDMASFGIDIATGQLVTKAKLDYEARDTYMVTVTATDPSGLSDSVDVTIKVTDENEAPMISTGPSIVGPAMSYYAENDMVAVASYEGAALNSPSWSLSGDDAEDFGISSDGMLTFNNTPDYEMPEDAGGNNVYDVTVKATDGTNTVMKNVKVMVRNVDEMGTLVLSSTTPSVDAELTATLTDLDGMVSGETWQWARSMDGTSFMDIPGATMDTYSPVATDEGYYLRATVMYTDGHGSGKEEMMLTADKVVAVAMGLTVTGRSSVDYMENRTDSVATYTATDPESATITWSLGGDDEGDFSIVGGVLSFGSAPDYENPTDMGMDNMYMVTVMADDGTNMASRDVMVTVTDVDEATPMDLLTSYDANNNGEIDLDEVFTAIDDYFDYDDRLTLEEVFEIVDLYFEGS